VTKADLKVIADLLSTSNDPEAKRLCKKIHKELIPTKIASRKGKGRNLQKRVAEAISNHTGLAWGKDELIASREMGQSGTDVRLIGEAKRWFPFAIECKSGESWSLPATIRQAQANQDADTDWLVVLKRKEWNNPVVCLDFDLFMKIYFK